MMVLGIIFCVVAGLFIGWGKQTGRQFIIKMILGLLAYSAGTFTTLAR